MSLQAYEWNATQIPPLKSPVKLTKAKVIDPSLKETCNFTISRNSCVVRYEPKLPLESVLPDTMLFSGATLVKVILYWETRFCTAIINGVDLFDFALMSNKLPYSIVQKFLLFNIPRDTSLAIRIDLRDFEIHNQLLFNQYHVIVKEVTKEPDNLQPDNLQPSSLPLI